MVIFDLLESEIMSSIRSTLIRSCFSNIQRELNQLEDWLNRDYSELPPSVTSTASDGNIIYQAIQQLSKQLDSQQHTLHHIIDRIDVLEETRNIHIQDKDENDAKLWLDTEGVQLQNEIIDNEYEPIVNVNKTDDDTLPTIVPPVVEAPIVVPPVVEAPVEVPSVVEAPIEVPPVVEAPVEVPPVVEAPVQEQEEQEEDDGLEEMEWNGNTYYRDDNLIIYQLNEEGELTDPVGVWKEKSQTIKFYKK